MSCLGPGTYGLDSDELENELSDRCRDGVEDIVRSS